MCCVFCFFFIKRFKQKSFCDSDFILLEDERVLFQLEHIVITFNCGETVMNFAEAALVIQGSACVYSKKVKTKNPQK